MATPSGQKLREEPDLIGAMINGRYMISSLIARGGMGKVFKAEQSALGRECALKVLAPNYDGDRDPEFHKRFSLEAATAAKLSHPNAVTIFDYGKCDEHNVYYIAMEYLDGRTLHRVIHQEHAIAEARARHIAQQICRAVSEAHRLGVVHRDLKPSNVMLLDRGDDPDFVKVLDFGLVKDVSGTGEELTQTGLFMGSPKYMAPEQIVGGEITARTDVYALGVMMYEMICGKVPFDRKAGMGTLVAHVNETPPPFHKRNPDAVASPEFEAVVMRCLEKEPDKRYASMRELLNALKRSGGDITDTYESLPRVRLDSDGRPMMASDPSLASTSGSGPRGQISSVSSITSRGSAPPPSASGGTLRSAITQSNPAIRDGHITGSGPIVPAAAAPARGGSIKPYAFALIASIVGGGTAAFVMSKQMREPAKHAAAESPSAVPTGAIAVAIAHSGEAPKGPGIRILRIESDPPGATVSDRGVEVCMATPCEIYWRGETAKLEHTLTLNKKGFKPTTVVVGPDEEKVLGKLDIFTLTDIAALGTAGPRPDVTPPPAPTATANAEPTVQPTATAAVVAAPKPDPTPAATPTPTVAPTVAPTPEAPVAAAPPAIMSLEEGMTRPTMISGGSPAYTREALAAKVEGTVVAKCVITASGAVTNCKIVKGLPFLDEAVIASLQARRYTPAMHQGKPVSVYYPFTIKMKLP